jgi:hypothetical protein
MAVGTISGALIAVGREAPKFGTLLIGSAVFGIGCTFAALAPGYPVSVNKIHSFKKLGTFTGTRCYLFRR